MSLSGVKGEDRCLAVWIRFSMLAVRNAKIAYVTNEIYAHPDLATEAGRRETEALASLNTREDAALLGMVCTAYSELLGAVASRGFQEMRK